MQQIRRRHGADGAAVYAEANAAAVELVARLAARGGHRLRPRAPPGPHLRGHEDERSAVEDEHEAAAEAGPARDARRRRRPAVPDVRRGPPRRPGPAAPRQVRPGARGGRRRRRLARLRADPRDRPRRGRPCRVETEHGTVTAQQVVVATHYPVFDRGLLLRAAWSPSARTASACGCAATCRRACRSTPASTTRSVRSYDSTLVLGGEGHTAGAREATPERFETLERFAREHWAVEAVTHRWSAQDPSSWDLMPIAGRYHPRTTACSRRRASTSGASPTAWPPRRSSPTSSPGARTRGPTASTPTASASPACRRSRQLGSKFVADMVIDRVRPADRAADRPRRARQEGRPPRRGRHGARRLVALHAPRLPRALERRRAQLGLPLPRLALRRRRHRPRGPGGQAARSPATPSGSRARLRPPRP